MPVVAYYLGRPARIWITAMSGSAGNTTEPGRTAPLAVRDPRCRAAKDRASSGSRHESDSPGELEVVAAGSVTSFAEIAGA